MIALLQAFMFSPSLVLAGFDKWSGVVMISGSRQIFWPSFIAKEHDFLKLLLQSRTSFLGGCCVALACYQI